MGLIDRFLDDLAGKASRECADRQRWLEQELAAKLKRMEARIMSALDDKLAELEAAQDAAHTQIAREIDALAKAIAAQAPDLTPQVNRVAAVVDKLKSDTAALLASDPVPAPAPAAAPAAAAPADPAPAPAAPAAPSA